MRRPIVKRDYDLSTKKDWSWFLVIEKHAVLTEVRGFDDPHIDKTRCLQIIKKLLYLLNQGEIFTKSEAAAILSSAVNLYHFEDVHLRRMFHLIARDLCPIADEVPLVTSSLLEDVNTGNVAYRATAICLLRLITNDTSLSQVVKFLAKTLCDDNPMLQIASHVCAINLVKGDPRMAITLDQAYPSRTAYPDGRDSFPCHIPRICDGTSTSSRMHFLENGDTLFFSFFYFVVGVLHFDSLYFPGIALFLVLKYYLRP
ncbi:coatomer subunit gamma-like [Salvia splendens]|uniref:coatomer subunit gamma-like n=1 Tax=Salvia splendens TaxID=180675 RepID=UPI001C2796A3|nr:coatomer subunit gamma-like [Salvia splendens]